MSSFIRSVKSIFVISELRSRIKYTVYLLFLYRLGTVITLPGVNTDLLTKHTSGLLGLLDSFLGGAFSNLSVFGLGIMPYINASIVMQLVSLAIPYFQRIQREGQSGRLKIHQITKILTIFIAIGQSIAYLNFSITDEVLLIDRFWFICFSVFILTAGSMICLWIGDRITDNGIGNGISVLIMVGIVSSLPTTLFEEYSLVTRQNSLIVFLIELLVLLFIVATTILLNKAVRKIPLNYASEFKREIRDNKSYFPVRVIGAGVMPIIFGQVLMFLLSFIFRWLKDKSDTLSYINYIMSDSTTWQYNLVFAILIILFTYLYTAININPMQISEDLKHNNSFIPGIKPGKATADYIDLILSRLTFWGSICLAFIAIIPSIAHACGISKEFSRFFGGTSLIILVSVILECNQYIKSYLLIHKYDYIMSFEDLSNMDNK